MDRAVGREGHCAVGKIAEERENHRYLVADSVNEQAENNDAHAEWPDARALQFTGANLIEAEVRDELPAAENHAADEGVARGDEGDEAAPEQDFVVAVGHIVG